MYELLSIVLTALIFPALLLIYQKIGELAAEVATLKNENEQCKTCPVHREKRFNKKEVISNV